MRRVLPLVLLVLAFSACAEQPIVDPSPGGQGTYRPDEVVLRVERIGGFVPAEALVTYLPALTVYGDGRVISPGPVIDIYPGPALPNVEVQWIAPEAVRTLVKLAVAAKVGVPADFGQPHVADGTSTRITVLAAAGEQVSTVYLLGLDDGLTAQQRAARAPLRDLVAKLEDLPGTLGEGSVGQRGPYVPEVLAVVDAPWVADPTVTEPEQAWPGPALPAQKVGAPGGNLGCVTVSGAQLATALDAAAQANQLTPWLWDATRYRLQFRPLLPDESSCDDLGQR